jgi:TolA-binding protein
MAQTNKDLLTRLADRGEQVVGRITDLPGAKTLMDRMTALTKRLDETQRRLRSLDQFEKRVVSLEKRLDKIEGKGSATKRTTSRKTSASPTAKAAPKRSATRRKPSGSSF